jgi:AcrR family transcriptional regulator
MDELAAEAGIAKGVLYDCFPGGKDELYQRLLERAEQLFSRDVVEALQDPRGGIVSVVGTAARAFVTFAGADRPAFDLLFGTPVMPGKQNAMRLHVARSRADKVLSRLLSSRLEEVGIKPARSDVVVIIGVSVALARRAGDGSLPPGIEDGCVALIARGLARGGTRAATPVSTGKATTATRSAQPRR